MSLLKKVKEEWSPTENRGLKVGEVIDITDYTALVRSGAAVLVDEEGNELPLPGQKYSCPICFSEFTDVVDFTTHVNTQHKLGKPREASVDVMAEPVVESTPEVKVDTDEEAKVRGEISVEESLRNKRLANLAKARAARKAKNR